MSLIKGNHAGLGGSGAPGGALGSFYSHTIDQSLKMDDASGAYLTISSASPTATDRKKVTISCWVKRSQITDSGVCTIFHGAGNGLMMQFLGGSNTDQLYLYESPWQIISDRLFRDAGAWMHFALILDSTQSTDSNRSKLYINGELQDLSSWTVGSGANRYPALNYQFTWHTGSTMRIGSVGDASDLGGYLADFISIDGQNVSISDLGETNDGVWVPKDVSGLTLGDAGFYLKFDNSSDIGNDSGSNNIDFNATNLAATDVVPDSPTNNWCTNNGVMRANITHSEGNLKMVGVGGNFDNTAGTFLFDVEDTDGWYWEGYVNSGGVEVRFGISKPQNVYFNQSDPTYNFAHSSDGIAYKGNGSKSTGGTDSSYGDSFTTGDVIGIAVKAGALYFYKNGSIQNSGTAAATGLTGQYVPAVSINSTLSLSTNYGQDSTFAGAVTAGGNSDANGLGDFKHSVPSGYKALCASNLPDITIGPGQSSQADDNFNTVLYTGNGSTQSITGAGFQPDWVWLKARGFASGHALFDSVRGATEYLASETTTAESTLSDTLTSFDSDGFSLGANNGTNRNSTTFVSWNWKAGGSASSNSDGSITSSVSANTDARFSIATWTGTGSAGATVGHGLGAVPDVMIVKKRAGGSAYGWAVWHKDANDNSTDFLRLDTTDAQSDQDMWNDTNPTSTVLSLGANNYTNYPSGATYVGYFFKGIEGYSKFGSYVGNGNADGTFVYTGFRPAWIMMKVAVGGTGNWFILDSTRSAINEADDRLNADTTGAESTSNSDIDFLSNGFKIRTASTSGINQNTDTHIYLAFAEAPFKFANAR